MEWALQRGGDVIGLATRPAESVLDKKESHLVTGNRETVLMTRNKGKGKE